jgi:hypothetical protein
MADSAGNIAAVLKYKHVCVNGPVWGAVTAAQTDQYVGLANLGGSVWVATGRGQAGSTPTNTMKTTDGGQTWAAAGTIPNYGNNTPLNLKYNPVSGRLTAWMGFGRTHSDDLGATWAAAVVPPATQFSECLTPTGTIAKIFYDTTNQRFLLFEKGGVRTWTTTDFVTFTQRGNLPRDGYTLTDAAGLTLVAQNGNNIVVAYADGGVAQVCSYTFNGGLTWADSAHLPYNALVNIIFGEGCFFTNANAGGHSNISIDGGQTWSATGTDLTVTKTWFIGFTPPNKFLAVGGGPTDNIANFGLC